MDGDDDYNDDDDEYDEDGEGGGQPAVRVVRVGTKPHPPTRMGSRGPRR